MLRADVEVDVEMSRQRHLPPPDPARGSLGARRQLSPAKDTGLPVSARLTNDASMASEPDSEVHVCWQYLAMRRVSMRMLA
ncbi:MAG: hypothetical protein K2Z25_24845, partial [Beijerinckiaceae bacterium]|nr:hypothetical protein [Beijerinckiaceae bacterium]